MPNFFYHNYFESNPKDNRDDKKIYCTGFIKNFVDY